MDDNNMDLILKLTALVVGLALCWMIPSCNGFGAFGPRKVFTAHITKTYVSTENKESHYMVGTDVGTFEVSNHRLNINGVFVTNADDIFASIESGKDYELTTVGNRSVGWWFQEYPYIIVATPSKHLTHIEIK